MILKFIIYHFLWFLALHCFQISPYRKFIKFLVRQNCVGPLLYDEIIKEALPCMTPGQVQGSLLRW